MKSMKTRVVAALAAALLLTLGDGIARAQETPQVEQGRERLQQMADRLQLTPEQREQVRPVVLEEFQQLKAIRDKYKTDKTDGGANRRTKLKMAREMRDVQKSADDKLKKVLSAQQMDELKKIREEWRQQMRDRMAER